MDQKEQDRPTRRRSAETDWRVSIERAKKGRALGQSLRKGKTSSLQTWAKRVRRAG